MILVIETATAACSVALLDGGGIVAEAHEEVGRGHAERLMPMIAGLPGGGRADAILVGCGPGSFTGVRVGIAAARALGLGWGVPVTGYPTLALIAAPLFEGGDAPAALAVAIQGGHGQLFVQRFAGLPLHPLDDLASLIPRDAALLPDRLVVGTGAGQVVAARGHGDSLERLPRASDARFLPAGLTVLPPSPIYGREPDAKRPANAS